jgi:general stress protein 26
MRKSSVCIKKFKDAKIVFMTTFSASGEEHSRPMLNLNEDPYEFMWFPTDTDTRKVEDVKANGRVLVTFPAEKSGEYYEVEGKGELADREFVTENWMWWYLYWHPDQKDRFWFPENGNHPERSIIWMYPHSVKLVKGNKVVEMEKKMPPF